MTRSSKNKRHHYPHPYDKQMVFGFHSYWLLPLAFSLLLHHSTQAFIPSQQQGQQSSSSFRREGRHVLKETHPAEESSSLSFSDPKVADMEMTRQVILNFMDDQQKNEKRNGESETQMENNPGMPSPEKMSLQENNNNNGKVLMEGPVFSDPLITLGDLEEREAYENQRKFAGDSKTLTDDDFDNNTFVSPDASNFLNDDSKGAKLQKLVKKAEASKQQFSDKAASYLNGSSPSLKPSSVASKQENNNEICLNNNGNGPLNGFGYDCATQERNGQGSSTESMQLGKSTDTPDGRIETEVEESSDVISSYSVAAQPEKKEAISLSQSELKEKAMDSEETQNEMVRVSDDVNDSPINVDATEISSPVSYSESTDTDDSNMESDEVQNKSEHPSASSWSAASYLPRHKGIVAKLQKLVKKAEDCKQQYSALSPLTSPTALPKQSTISSKVKERENTSMDDQKATKKIEPKIKRGEKDRLQKKRKQNEKIEATERNLDEGKRLKQDDVQDAVLPVGSSSSSQLEVNGKATLSHREKSKIVETKDDESYLTIDSKSRSNITDMKNLASSPESMKTNGKTRRKLEPQKEASMELLREKIEQEIERGETARLKNKQKYVQEKDKIKEKSKEIKELTQDDNEAESSIKSQANGSAESAMPSVSPRQGDQSMGIAYKSNVTAETTAGGLQLNSPESEDAIGSNEEMQSDEKEKQPILASLAPDGGDINNGLFGAEETKPPNEDGEKGKDVSGKQSTSWSCEDDAMGLSEISFVSLPNDDNSFSSGGVKSESRYQKAKLSPREKLVDPAKESDIEKTRQIILNFVNVQEKTEDFAISKNITDDDSQTFSSVPGVNETTLQHPFLEPEFNSNTKKIEYKKGEIIEGNNYGSALTINSQSNSNVTDMKSVVSSLEPMNTDEITTPMDGPETEATMELLRENSEMEISRFKNKQNNVQEGDEIEGNSIEIIEPLQNYNEAELITRPQAEGPIERVIPSVSQLRGDQTTDAAYESNVIAETTAGGLQPNSPKSEDAIGANEEMQSIKKDKKPVSTLLALDGEESNNNWFDAEINLNNEAEEKGKGVSHKHSTSLNGEDVAMSSLQSSFESLPNDDKSVSPGEEESENRFQTSSSTKSASFLPGEEIELFTREKLVGPAKEADTEKTRQAILNLDVGISEEISDDDLQNISSVSKVYEASLEHSFLEPEFNANANYFEDKKSEIKVGNDDQSALTIYSKSDSNVTDIKSLVYSLETMNTVDRTTPKNEPEKEATMELLQENIELEILRGEAARLKNKQKYVEEADEIKENSIELKENSSEMKELVENDVGAESSIIPRSQGSTESVLLSVSQLTGDQTAGAANESNVLRETTAEGRQINFPESEDAIGSNEELHSDEKEMQEALASLALDGGDRNNDLFGAKTMMNNDNGDKGNDESGRNVENLHDEDNAKSSSKASMVSSSIDCNLLSSTKNSSTLRPENRHEKSTETLAQGENFVDNGDLLEAQETAASLFSVEVKPDVPEDTIKGSAIAAMVVASLVGSSWMVTLAIAPFIAAYITNTRGGIGDLSRVAGEFTWELAVAMGQSFKELDEKTKVFEIPKAALNLGAEAIRSGVKISSIVAEKFVAAAENSLIAASRALEARDMSLYKEINMRRLQREERIHRSLLEKRLEMEATSRVQVENLDYEDVKTIVEGTRVRAEERLQRLLLQKRLEMEAAPLIPGNNSRQKESAESMQRETIESIPNSNDTKSEPEVTGNENETTVSATLRDAGNVINYRVDGFKFDSKVKEMNRLGPSTAAIYLGKNVNQVKADGSLMLKSVTEEELENEASRPLNLDAAMIETNLAYHLSLKPTAMEDGQEGSANVGVKKEPAAIQDDEVDQIKFDSNKTESSRLGPSPSTDSLYFAKKIDVPTKYNTMIERVSEKTFEATTAQLVSEKRKIREKDYFKVGKADSKLESTSMSTESVDYREYEDADGPPEQQEDVARSNVQTDSVLKTANESDSQARIFVAQPVVPTLEYAITESVISEAFSQEKTPTETYEAIEDGSSSSMAENDGLLSSVEPKNHDGNIQLEKIRAEKAFKEKGYLNVEQGTKATFEKDHGENRFRKDVEEEARLKLAEEKKLAEKEETRRLAVQQEVVEKKVDDETIFRLNKRNEKAVRLISAEMEKAERGRKEMQSKGLHEIAKLRDKIRIAGKEKATRTPKRVQNQPNKTSLRPLRKSDEEQVEKLRKEIQRRAKETYLKRHVPNQDESREDTTSRVTHDGINDGKILVHQRSPIERLAMCLLYASAPTLVHHNKDIAKNGRTVDKQSVE